MNALIDWQKFPLRDVFEILRRDLKVVDFDYDTQKYFRHGDIEGGVTITFHNKT